MGADSSRVIKLKNAYIDWLVPETDLRFRMGIQELRCQARLAAHAVGIASDAYCDGKWPFSLWLAPTNTIRRQTVEALKNPAHPYRQALTARFGE